MTRTMYRRLCWFVVPHIYRYGNMFASQLVATKIRISYSLVYAFKGILAPGNSNRALLIRYNSC